MVLEFKYILEEKIYKRNINLQTFVTDNFYSIDGYNISYNNFALLVLVEYKTAVKNLLGIDDNGNQVVSEDGELNNQISFDEEEEVKPNDNTKILFANLILTIGEMQNAINEDIKIKFTDKEELLIVLKALSRAVHLEELIIINALLVPLEYKLGKNKKHKRLYDKLKMLIADIYY